MMVYKQAEDIDLHPRNKLWSVSIGPLARRQLQPTSKETMTGAQIGLEIIANIEITTRDRDLQSLLEIETEETPPTKET